MQREWYCLAVHKNTHEHTFEYVGDRLPKMLDFVILCFLSSFPYETPDWHSLQAKAVIELRRFYRSSPFQSVCLQTGKGGGFD